MEFADIVKQRHAVKSFNGQALEEEKVDALLEMIRYAPTSFNLQPWKVQVITDQEIKNKLQEACWNQPQVGSCSHLLVFYANTDLEALIEQLSAAMLESGVPEDKVQGFIGILKKFIEALSGEKRQAWAEKQTYIALGNGMNGAKALGFDSCPMEGFSPPQVKEILNPPEHLVTACLLPIGYSDAEARPKVRFKKEELFF